MQREVLNMVLRDDGIYVWEGKLKNSEEKGRNYQPRENLEEMIEKAVNGDTPKNPLYR